MLSAVDCRKTDVENLTSTLFRLFLPGYCSKTCVAALDVLPEERLTKNGRSAPPQNCGQLVLQYGVLNRPSPRR
jgi:hypothetical protein